MGPYYFGANEGGCRETSYAQKAVFMGIADFTDEERKVLVVREEMQLQVCRLPQPFKIGNNI